MENAGVACGWSWRYSDDHLNSTEDEPYPNAFRYRDWVIQAFNEDLPFDQFVKAQLAGALLQEAGEAGNVGGLGFYALSPQFQDDRVDATKRIRFTRMISRPPSCTWRVWITPG